MAAGAICLSGCFSCSRDKKNPENAFSLISYNYDTISEVTEKDSLIDQDALYWRSVGQGVLPEAMGEADTRLLRDTLEKLGFVEFAEKNVASPRQAPHLKIIDKNAKEVQADNYSVNHLSIRLFTPRIAVWKSSLVYYLAGAAHPRYSTKYVNYAIKEGKILSLSDLFKPGYEKTLREMLKERVMENPEAYDDAEINIPDNFYIGSEGITFVYGLYEVAPYSAGEIEVPFYIYELNEILKPGVEELTEGYIDPDL